MTDSKHLEGIIAKQNHLTPLQVVFIDIEKYSRRRTKTQTEVIERFTTVLRDVLTETSARFVSYAQDNNVNFQTDIIRIPTGDGAAIVFPFHGLSEIHLFFSQALLRGIDKQNKG